MTRELPVRRGVVLDDVVVVVGRVQVRRHDGAEAAAHAGGAVRDGEGVRARLHDWGVVVDVDDGDRHCRVVDGVAFRVLHLLTKFVYT